MSEEVYPPEVIALASALHEQWRNGFDPEPKTGKERIKKNSDGTEGNINVPFDQLHFDWKKENLLAGVAAKASVDKFPLDEDLEKASDYIHEEWMKRNPKESWNAHQHVPYVELPDSEKEKDRVQVRMMKDFLKNHSNTIASGDSSSSSSKGKSNKCIVC